MPLVGTKIGDPVNPLGALDALPAWAALLLVFLVPALEASAVAGAVLPGQSAIVAGGLLAYQGRLPFGAVLTAAVLGAVVGPGIGYAVGRRWGPTMHRRIPRWLLRPADVARAERVIHRIGGPAIAGARFITVLRTLVPVLSGKARVPCRTFLLWNALGGAAWALCGVLLGMAAGSGRRLAEGPGAVAATGVVVAAALLFVGVRAGVRRYLRLADGAKGSSRSASG